MSGAHVAVIGGGYSGTAQAIALLRQGLAVTLIERTPRLARGVAYGTAAPDHLLNVRASAMSAFADAPSDFVDWLIAEGEGDADTFAPRRSFGRYLSERLEAARQAAGGRLRVVADEAVAIEDRADVRLASGGSVAADAVILAVGNLPPERIRAIPAGLPDGLYISDPWARDLASGLSDDDDVLLIGTGLTAVDAALSLDSAGFRGRMLALSRRGLLPRAHAPAPIARAPLDEPLPRQCAELLASVRQVAKQTDWRAAVDTLRPVTQQLWREAGRAEQARFLRHLRPWWDVHRHRIAPAIADRVDALRREDRLAAAAGKIISVTPGGGGTAQVEWRPRGRAAPERTLVRRIVNCTGPQANIARAGDTLLDGLLEDGRIRPDPGRIGIDVDAASRAIGRDETASDVLLAIGPMTRGAFWEIVAVPDIRGQVREVAERLSTILVPNRE